MRWLKLGALVLITSLSLGATPAYAASVVFGNNPDTCAKGAGSAGCSASNDNPIPKVINGAINAFTFIGGALSVIFIIVGGVKYVTANGDPAAIESARDTVIYAIVGLLILVIARVIVGFVIRRL